MRARLFIARCSHFCGFFFRAASRASWNYNGVSRDRAAAAAVTAFLWNCRGFRARRAARAARLSGSLEDRARARAASPVTMKISYKAACAHSSELMRIARGSGALDFYTLGAREMSAFLA